MHRQRAGWRCVGLAAGRLQRILQVLLIVFKDSLSIILQLLLLRALLPFLVLFRAAVACVAAVRDPFLPGLDLSAQRIQAIPFPADQSSGVGLLRRCLWPPR